MSPTGDGVQAWVGLGSNLGDPRRMLDSALRSLRELPGTELSAVSSYYRSAPVLADGPDFLNAAVRLHTRLGPLALLDALQALERQHDRQRPYPNAPRTLDLDLLLHGDSRLDSPTLTLPHPRLHLRAFVLAPLAELDPELVIASRGAVSALLRQCADQRIERLQAAQANG